MALLPQYAISELVLHKVLGVIGLSSVSILITDSGSYLTDEHQFYREWRVTNYQGVDLTIWVKFDEAGFDSSSMGVLTIGVINGKRRKEALRCMDECLQNLGAVRLH
jgi:hypothetical protein